MLTPECQTRETTFELYAEIYRISSFSYKYFRHTNLQVHYYSRHKLRLHSEKQLGTPICIAEPLIAFTQNQTVGTAVTSSNVIIGCVFTV